MTPWSCLLGAVLQADSMTAMKLETANLEYLFIVVPLEKKPWVNTAISLALNA